MIDQFIRILQTNQWQHKQMIVAVSGGVDSMTLAALLYAAQVPLVIAHCNFSLRGAASDADEALVSAWAKERHIPCHVQRFDTRAILHMQKGNLQATARHLRYTWFEQLRVDLNFDLIALAHHREDNVETVLHHFIRGTGIAGMRGMQVQNGMLIRPLLAISKAELTEYARSHQIPWREDASNATDDYRRNQIRHRVIPALESVAPQALPQMAHSIARLSEAAQLYEQAIEGYRKKLLTPRGADVYISIRRLRQCRPLATILMELLKPFGFRASQVPQAIHLLQAETGRQLQSDTHRMIVNRGFLILTPLTTTESDFIVIPEFDENIRIAANSFALQLSILTPGEGDRKEQIRSAPPATAYAALDALTFPLTLRRWRPGDYFYPFGMQRKKKKLRKFLIEQKIPLHEKENVWVLASGSKIVWVVGMRLDERMKVTDFNKPVLQIKVHSPAADSQPPVRR